MATKIKVVPLTKDTAAIDSFKKSIDNLLADKELEMTDFLIVYSSKGFFDYSMYGPVDSVVANIERVKLDLLLEGPVDE